MERLHFRIWLFWDPENSKNSNSGIQSWTQGFVSPMPCTALYIQNFRNEKSKIFYRFLVQNSDKYNFQNWITLLFIYYFAMIMNEKYILLLRFKSHYLKNSRYYRRPCGRSGLSILREFSCTFFQRNVIKFGRSISISIAGVLILIIVCAVCIGQ